ncbi:two-component sensor histidine kinase [Luteitalea sp. TBR-22]|uniref:ATP-binding protein n=1 Tax=Luteitalea sp. TBR-22 TaxID=2802971 RepID=UPI001AF9293C|nr:ATP-binding protein [Luteitalea sp. TBR-22]BCS32509.1 two-component sensor histidine kinase [Luteitalea sp. TBR-22]
MRTPTLRTRLTIWFAASLLLILAPCFGALLWVEWRTMREALDHHLREDLEVAAEMIVPAGAAVTWRTPSDRDLGYDGARQRWVEVYGAQGESLYLRGLPAWNPAIPASMPLPHAAAAGLQTIRTPAGAHVRVLSVSRTLEGRRIWLRVARTEDPLRQDFRRLLLLFAGGVPLAVLVAATAGYVISGWMLTPLARMADQARVISADRLSERLPIENPTDELGMLAVVFNDTFSRLEASFAHLKRFTADASHELRTPLTALKSVGEVGLRESMTPAEYREVIGSMLEEADRLAALVDTLLTLSRWESGRTRPSFSALDLAEVAREVVERIGILAEDGGVAIDVDLPAPLPALADPSMVRQAILNVLDNAIKFTPAGRRIRVWGETTGGVSRVVVDDEGPGIPVEERSRVLDRFYRVTTDGTSHVPGTGLGLSIVHRAIVINHGRFLLTESPTKGTRAVLELPRP